MWKIRNSGCFFKLGFKWSYMSVVVAPGNCLTITNRFWESKLPSIPFNMNSPTMQMVPSGHFFRVSLDGRLPSCVTGVKEIGVFSSGFSGIASLFLFRYLEWCSARIFLNFSEMLRLSLCGESRIRHWSHVTKSRIFKNPNLTLYCLVSTKRSHILKQISVFHLQVCLNMCDLLVDTRH